MQANRAQATDILGEAEKLMALNGDDEPASPRFDVGRSAPEPQGEGVGVRRGLGVEWE